MCNESDRTLGFTRRGIVGLAALAGSGGWLLSPAGAQSQTQERAAEAIEQLISPTPEALIARAFAMRDHAVAEGDRPYGALVADAAGIIVGQAPSRVITRGDPTAHAEMEAIRDAASALGSRSLAGHTLYSSSRPCPMCEAAAYWAGVERMVHGRDARDGGVPGLCG